MTAKDDQSTTYQDDMVLTTWAACNDVVDLRLESPSSTTTTWWTAAAEQTRNTRQYQNRRREKIPLSALLLFPQDHQKQYHKEYKAIQEQHDDHLFVVEQETAWQRIRPTTGNTSTGAGDVSTSPAACCSPPPLTFTKEKRTPSLLTKNTRAFLSRPTRRIPSKSSTTSMIEHHHTNCKNDVSDSVLVAGVPSLLVKSKLEAQRKSTTLRNWESYDQCTFEDYGAGPDSCSTSYNKVLYHRDLLTDDLSMFNQQLIKFRLGSRGRRPES